MSKTETTQSPRVTYLDCLKGTAPVPRGGVEKKTFTLLMICGMVTFMVNFNGVLHSGLGFYPHGVWLIPIVFCIAFLVKTQLVGKFTEMLIGKLVIPNLTGFKKGLGITLCNVCVMAPIMSSIVTLLLQGTDGYFAYLAHALPISVAAALPINTFIVGPIAKMLYNNYFAVRGPTQTTHRIARHVMDIAYMLND